MGGPERTPGQARRALDEAITIMREIWDTGVRGGVRVQGREYVIDGAKRGPAPAHEIAVWVGALGPLMLELVGRRADGWLPSLSYLKEGLVTLAQMNARIDAAARAAGRTPADIRRLVNLGGPVAGPDGELLTGPVASWVPDLATLAVEYGVSGFILSSDDAQTIEEFGSRVAPEVRERVARERARD